MIKCPCKHFWHFRKVGKKMNARPVKYTAELIANWFINWNKIDVERNDAEDLTLLKLEKLLYYAEGCELAYHNTSLFANPILAWEHGPVVESIWRLYNENPRSLPALTDEQKEALKTIDAKDQQLLYDVYNVFGKYTAWGLREKTHEEDPWKNATDSGEHLNAEISRDSIREYFQKTYCAV